MGVIISRFRKKKSTLEQIEELDADIKAIEKFRLNTEVAQKKIVGQFIIVSAAIYVLVAALFYFYFFPDTYKDQIFYITPLLMVPFIILGVKRLLTWYYRRKISRNEAKLQALRADKKKLLEQVMDTETYKVAKKILEKFAPDQLRKSPTSYEMTPYKPLGIVPVSSTPSTSSVRARNVPAARNIISNIPARTPARVIAGPQTTAIGTPVPAAPQTNVPEGTMNVSRQVATQSIPLPREIIPRDRSVLDKMVEYLVGDGPSNRFALICKNCQSHNGMALREEFEYIAFRCCYCFAFNPSRKLRPQAPRLELDLSRTPLRKNSAGSSTSSSEERVSDSDTESDHHQHELQQENKDNSSSRKNSESLAEPMDTDPIPVTPETKPEIKKEEEIIIEKKFE